MTALALAAASLATAAGTVVHGSVGFGLALVAAPFLVLIDARLVPGPLMFAALLLTLLMAVREWQSMDLAGATFGIAGRLPGTAVGAAALALLPAREMTVLFGVLVLLAVAMSASGLRFRPTSWALFWAGVISGFMGTISAIGGPPIALLYQDAPGPRLRSTLSAFFVVGAVISLIALHVVGRFGWYEIRVSLALVPAVLAGYAVSVRMAPILDRHHTRPAVLAVAAAGAIAVIVWELV